MLMLQVLRKAKKQVLAPKSNDNNSLGESLQEEPFSIQTNEQSIQLLLKSSVWSVSSVSIVPSKQLHSCISLSNKESIKTTMRYQFIPTGKATIKKTDSKCWWGLEIRILKLLMT